MLSVIPRIFGRSWSSVLTIRKLNIQHSSRFSCTNPLQTSHQDSDDVSDPVVLHQDFEDYKQKDYLLTQLRNLLHYTPKDAEKFQYFSENLKSTNTFQIIDNVRFLLDQNIPPESVMENPWLLQHSKNVLTIKLFYLQKMKPIEITDFLPLLQVKTDKLRIISNSFDSQALPRSHRIYYFSNCLEIEPKIISKHLSMCVSTFIIPFAKLSQTLNIMFKYKIDKKDIVKTLKAFDRPPETVEFRLKEMKEAGIEKPIHWMTYCSETRFRNALNSFKKQKEVLGKGQTNLEYLSQRLDIDMDTMRLLTSKNSQILRMKTTKIKDHLDYLLDEEGFNPQDIAKSIRVLFFRLDVIKKRVQRLREAGVEACILGRITQGRVQFERYLEKRTSTLTESEKNEDYY